jgi:hypothetical protein
VTVACFHKLSELKKMKFIKPLFFFAGVVTILACGAVNDRSTTPPVNAPIEMLTVPASVIPRQVYTPTPPSVFLLPTPQLLSFPDWVTDFSDPILMTLEGQRPDFQDDFGGLNQGWFYFIPDSPRGPFYADIQKDEALVIKLPAENEIRDYWVYNPRLTRKDFVLSFELWFKESQPEDTVRFQFDQTADQSMALDLSKSQTWTLHWGSQADWQSTTGTYDYFDPERMTILIMMQGEECAIYLNDDPLTYLSNCRSGSIVRSSPWAVTFHILAEPGHTAIATIDNVKLWDLDKITGLP